MIVDDEEILRKLLHHWLSKDGFDCTEADCGEQALGKLLYDPADLVILDVRMPGKSGIEILPEIKNIQPNTAVIMATALSDSQTAVRCMKNGAYDFLTKPYDLPEVSKSVESALEKRKMEIREREYQRHIEDLAKERLLLAHNSFINAVTSLAYALEAKDKYTSGHSERVAKIAAAIASKMDLPSDMIEKIRLAGMVHDIGKIGVRESILNKPAKLTQDEFQNVKQHCEKGEHILAPALNDDSILQAVRHHHENFDGTGYPDHLSGDEIPLLARILAVADSYDAMVSERPYRHAMSVKVACEEIIKCINGRYDPAIVRAFYSAVKTSGLSCFSEEKNDTEHTGC